MYSNSKIYKLQCNDGYFYIGSTCDELRKRLWGHKKTSKTKNHIKVYKHINSIGWDNVSIILIESFECNNKDELRKKEDEYIQKELNNELCLNSQRAYLTEEETKEYDKNLMRIKRQDSNYTNKEKEYYQNNKEQIRERQKEYESSPEYKQKKKQYYREYRLKKKQEKNNNINNINDIEGFEG
jgi:Uri superfamily endonuclease